MIWIIIGLVVCIIVIVDIVKDWSNSWLEKILYSILSLIATIVVVLMVLVIPSIITSEYSEVEYKMISDEKIVALKDNQNINGDFYIMGGYVDEDLYYYYATETEFGYGMEKIKASNSYIKHTDKETHIERYVGDFKNKKSYLFGFPMYNDRYIIYCPDGTVTNEFNVDLE